jgi:hypothetical protein
MAYEITAKGKEAIKKNPLAYKNLLSRISREKPEVVGITEGFNGKPIAAIKVYNVGVVRGSMTTIIGYTFKKEEAKKVAGDLERVLVDITRVNVIEDKTYFY